MVSIFVGIPVWASLSRSSLCSFPRINPKHITNLRLSSSQFVGLRRNIVDILFTLYVFSKFERNYLYWHILAWSMDKNKHFVGLFGQAWQLLSLFRNQRESAMVRDRLEEEIFEFILLLQVAALGKTLWQQFSHIFILYQFMWHANNGRFVCFLAPILAISPCDVSSCGHFGFCCTIASSFHMFF